MLKQRVLTAIVILLTVLFVILVLPETLFQCFVALIVVIGAWEWSKLAGLASITSRLLYTAVFMAALFIAQYYVSFALVPVLIISQLGWLLALAFISFYPKYTQLWASRISLYLIGFWVLFPLWLSVLYLRSQEGYVFQILMLLFLVASADIGAYFSGRAFGKSKLAPQVSPNKTWEGFWGGVVACSFLVVMVAGFYSLNYSLLSVKIWCQLIACAVLLASFSVVGDLLESMVKRFSGVKDSGNILPGHGGILDRIDGVTAAAPIYTLLVISLSEVFV